MAKALQSLAADRSVRSNTAPTLLERIEASQRLTAECIAPTKLAATIDALGSVALRVEASSVSGASPVGHFLSGALVLRSGRLALWSPPTTTQLLLLDGVVAGYSGLSRVATQARKLGATRINAIILGDLAEASDVVENVDRVFCLESAGLLAAA